MNYYIADMHFSHANVLAYDNRPFLTAEEMDETMINRWNNVVKTEDTVYILGDMFWKTAKDIGLTLGTLNGKKVLIRGNHDKVDNKLLKKFTKITDYLEITDENRNVVLCHYPIVCYKNHFHGWYHLYGHVHVSFEADMMESSQKIMRDLHKQDSRMYNVGCMMSYMDYTPRTLDEIVIGGEEYLKSKWGDSCCKR